MVANHGLPSCISGDGAFSHDTWAPDRPAARELHEFRSLRGRQALAHVNFRVIRSRTPKVNCRGRTLDNWSLVLGMVPGLVWLAYFSRKSLRPYRHFRHVLRVFLWGCAVTVPAGLLEHLTHARVEQQSLEQSIAVSFLLIAPLEEAFKLLAVWLGIYRRRDFREPIDGLVYSTTAALGFASVENAVYVGIFGPGVFLLRAVFATPAHVMFSAMWGYSMGLARFRRNRELVTILKGLMISVLLHGAYNCLVAVSPTTGVMSLIPLMVLMGWLMNRRIRDFRRNYPFPSLGQGALIWCPTCGAYALEGTQFCPRCGARVPPLEIDIPRFCSKCRALLDPCRGTCYRCGQEVTPWGACPPAP